ncbi:hypothetical protein [Chitinophaga sp. Cy-1792]|uniref:hypothetical protein n=1 Tax=Chitinophaga sp. Cy-1792 TaxID=2608339 RepID=UPI00141EF22D|nr:hypothetical protein [Chitinophaga sp. Cy-1792]NIG52331.1 hypothetical protein [Chitinophaga sp. Cy-1792]
MKLFLTCTCCLLIALSSCHSGRSTAPAKDSTATDSIKDVYAALKGTWSGDFGGSPIFITVNFANGKQAAGYNIHKGLRRNIHGAMKKDGDNWLLELTEPGDNPYDGRFAINITGNGQQLKGNWTPLNEKNTSAKSFVLSKEVHTENEGFDFFDSYDGDHGEGILTFRRDGSCELQFYPKVNDSTRAEQATIVRGTWQKVKGNHEKITVIWKTNSIWTDKSTTFDVAFYPNDQDHPEKGGYATEFKSDSLSFYHMP